MVIFNLVDIKSESQALTVAHELMDSAIEASESARGKKRKIRACESKINKLRKKCIVQGWQKPLSFMGNTIKILEEARSEADVGLWTI